MRWTLLRKRVACPCVRGLLSGDGCDGDCRVEPEPANPGDIIITEIMKNPMQVSVAVYVSN